MSSQKLLVTDLVGLTPSALAHAPRVRSFFSDGFVTPIATVFPAVTCTAQASFLTGAQPSSHGIVANGWYFRNLDEVFFWRQSRGLIEGTSIFDDLKQLGKTSANLFGWYNWNCGADYSITPKPSYPADGRKFPGIHTEPLELRTEIESTLGAFPLFNFWGPTAGIVSSEWIAKSTAHIINKNAPDFVFCYLPHLDYDHQRFGPGDARSIRAIGEMDRVAGELFETARGRGYEIIAFSEYGITDVSIPVFINKALRAAGLLRARLDPFAGELPLFGSSRAFAVCDHQIAHIYISEARDIEYVRKFLLAIDGVERVLDRNEQREYQIQHNNSGELVAIAKPNCWFAYNYWTDDALAPDFARTVDIHRKPGYDPAELFVDPTIVLPAARVAFNLLKKKLGFRYLMKMISLDPSMVRGSHGRLPQSNNSGAVALGTRAAGPPAELSITGLRASIQQFFQK